MKSRILQFIGSGQRQDGNGQFRLDRSKLFDFSKISEKRKHIYFYSVIFLLLLLAHLIKTAS